MRKRLLLAIEGQGGRVRVYIYTFRYIRIKKQSYFSFDKKLVNKNHKHQLFTGKKLKKIIKKKNNKKPFEGSFEKYCYPTIQEPLIKILRLCFL